jgi:hypothetical protein
MKRFYFMIKRGLENTIPLNMEGTKPVNKEGTPPLRGVPYPTL